MENHKIKQRVGKMARGPTHGPWVGGSWVGPSLLSKSQQRWGWCVNVILSLFKLWAIMIG